MPPTATLARPLVPAALLVLSLLLKLKINARTAVLVVSVTIPAWKTVMSALLVVMSKSKAKPVVNCVNLAPSLTLKVHPSAILAPLVPLNPLLVNPFVFLVLLVSTKTVKVNNVASTVFPESSPPLPHKLLVKTALLVRSTFSLVNKVALLVTRVSTKAMLVQPAVLLVLLVLLLLLLVPPTVTHARKVNSLLTSTPRNVSTVPLVNTNVKRVKLSALIAKSENMLQLVPPLVNSVPTRSVMLLVLVWLLVNCVLKIVNLMRPVLVACAVLVCSLVSLPPCMTLFPPTRLSLKSTT
jgi:hypothetical protein